MSDDFAGCVQVMDIFISYRRADSPTHAGRVHDLLRQFLGADSVFMDVENLAPGDKFIDVISSRLSACKVFIPIIGPRWVSPRSTVRCDPSTQDLAPPSVRYSAGSLTSAGAGTTSLTAPRQPE